MNPQNNQEPTGKGICVIMAGGRGTRFWPLSRTETPKQLQALASPNSLLRDTYERVVPLVGPERILVVTSLALGEATGKALPEVPAVNIICEPVGRNTAPCSVLGMGVARRIDPVAPVALLPADHFIPDETSFRQQLEQAFDRVREDPAVATLGIAPTRPETGYGYLQVASPTAGDAFLKGTAFNEKPDLDTARAYLEDGLHFWNSGIFVWNPDWFVTQVAEHLPEVGELMAPAIESFGTGNFAAELERAYGRCPAESIDVAVMEKLPGFAVLPVRFAWSDLGSWEAWGELASEIAGGNRGSAELLAIDSPGNIVRVPDKLVALLGVRDLVVVDTPDALLICHRDEVQRIKAVTEELEEQGREDLL